MNDELNKRELHDIFNQQIDNNISAEQLLDEWSYLKSQKLRKKKIDKLKSIIKSNPNQNETSN
ncbi:hypothetical protein [Carboxylicivirga sp. RSCT41]|uniref:hypothetical protein n=1 Tax=Carboxylicivirga agarovorans TaxID=3417570 RepID=UPI003D32C82A